MDRWSFCVRMQGVVLRLHTNSNYYFEYLQSYFSSLKQDSSIEADIEVFLDLEESLNRSSKWCNHWFESTELKRIGRRILVNEHEVVCDGINQLGDLKLRCVYGVQTKIYGCLSLIKSDYWLKRFYQQVVKKKQFNVYKYDVYAALTYYFVYYPVLYHLERYNISPLHASAVEAGGRKILMPGLPGVGKSTLCLAFLAQEHAKFLSDNIVLYDTKNVYSFFEPLKLDRYGMSLIDFDTDLLVKVGSDSYYDRDSFRVKDEYVTESMRPDVLLIPIRSSETSLIPISGQEATQLNCDFNNIAGELNAYLSYSSIQNLCHKNAGLALDRIERLRVLCDSLSCYIFCIKSGQHLSDVLRTVKSLW